MAGNGGARREPCVAGVGTSRHTAGNWEGDSHVRLGEGKKGKIM